MAGFFFFGDGTTSATSKTVTVKQDIWADPNLFISGKTGTDVLAQNYTGPSFLTTFQCETANKIQTYSANPIDELFFLYEYEPQYQAEDLSKIQVLRLRGRATGFIYCFIGVGIAKGGLLDVTKPINQRTDAANALATGSVFGETKGATFSLIIRDAAYNIIDPLTLYPEINFTFPTQVNVAKQNPAIALDNTTKIISAINIGYITQNVKPLQIQCLNNSPFPAAQPITLTPVSGQIADQSQTPSSTKNPVSQLISNTVGTNANVVDQQKTANALANRPETPTPDQQAAMNAQEGALNKK